MNITVFANGLGGHKQMKNVLLLCYYISAILAMLFSTEYYKCVIKLAENTLVNEEPSQSNGIKKCAGTVGSCIHDALIFSYISMLILPIAFIILYILQNIIPHDLKCISMLLSSGIHVPFILLLAGYIIRKCFLRFVKENDDFTIPMMKKAIMYMALTCDLALIMIDFTLGLFVLAIILGKFIWIDFVYDEANIHTLFSRMINECKKKENLASLYMFYALWFLVSFLVATSIYYLCVYIWHTSMEGTRNMMILYICAEIIITRCFIIILRHIR